MIHNEEIENEFNNVISKAFNIDVFSYNSEVTDNIWSVLKFIVENRPAYNTDIAEKLNLSTAHVELIQYLLCNNDNAEYGTSPRGCWMTEKGIIVFRKLRDLKDKDYEP